MAASGALTTSKLIASIKRRAMIPTGQDTFTVQDLIDFANEEMMIGIVPTLLRLKEDYLTFDEITPILPNQSKYTIPERALGNKLREVSYMISDGNEYEMAQLAVDDRYTFLVNSIENTNWRRFYMEGSDVVLFPQVGNNPQGSLRFFYHIRPNVLVTDAEVATITNIDRTTGIITLSNAPTNFGVAQKYDFIRARSPHNVISIDAISTAYSSGTKSITFAVANIPTSLVVGDYIGLAGESAIPNIPTELHSILAQRVAQRVLEALGDTAGLQNASAKLQEMESQMLIMLSERVDGAVRKVVQRNNLLGKRSRLSRRGII
jgi:hypothetical protein